MNKYALLEKIGNPDDIKKLSFEDLDILSKEICLFIHDVVSEIGGHYSSPLGAVDLTIALHYAYATPNDKLIWDVGHQAYSHKIITERRKEFTNIRQNDGISGFLKIDESKYDAFGAGHASTSVSAALGFAHARDKLKQTHQVVAIIGDGALTGGMAYEGLNNLGYHKTQMTVILNDNSYSISKSVGAVSKYLTRIVTNPTYNKIRKDLWNLTDKIPTFSSTIKRLIRKTEGSIKAYLTPGVLFEELGLRYIGPIDGHDIENMVKVLKSIKEMNTPVLLHVHTNKSKSIAMDDKDAIKYYSLSGNKSKDINSNNISFSSALGKSLYNLSEKNEFKCVTAAMKIGTGLKKFSQQYPERCIDVGIAEEHAVTYAAGLSAGGILPIIAIYSTFMQRAYDCIIHDIALQKLPAIFCLDRAGLVGHDGPTHHGVFDISFMRSIPNIVVTAPKDGNELLDLLNLGIKEKLILSIRYPKLNTLYSPGRTPQIIELGSWEILTEGLDVCILTFGSMIENCLYSANEINKKYNKNLVTIVNCRFIKPLDEKLLEKLLIRYNKFIVVEEGILSGGFGSSVLEFKSKLNSNSLIKIHAIDDSFTTHGDRKSLLELCKLDVNSITKSIDNYINEK
jgi:1-deoxy-D-xylulose-5-phosphate synthase